MVKIILTTERKRIYYSLQKSATIGKEKCHFKKIYHGHPFIITEEESPRVPRRGWAEMIRKVYEVNPLHCPKCQGQMRIIAFLADYGMVDRNIHHLKLTFVAERPPPPHVACQEILVAAETSAEFFS